MNAITRNLALVVQTTATAAPQISKLETVTISHFVGPQCVLEALAHIERSGKTGQAIINWSQGRATSLQWVEKQK